MDTQNKGFIYIFTNPSFENDSLKSSRNTAKFNLIFWGNTVNFAEIV